MLLRMAGQNNKVDVYRLQRGTVLAPYKINEDNGCDHAQELQGHSYFNKVRKFVATRRVNLNSKGKQQRKGGAERVP